MSFCGMYSGRACGKARLLTSRGSPGGSPSRRRDSGGFTLVQLLIVIAVIALIIAMLVPAVLRARVHGNLVLCADHLRQIGRGLDQYASLNHGFLPLAATVNGPQTELLHSLAASGCVGEPRNYYCPALLQPRFSDDNFKAGVIGYYYYVAVSASSDPHLSKFLRGGISWPRTLDLSMDPKSWVMSDIWVSGVPTAHGGYRKGINYLMLDGSVAFVGESPRQAFH